MALPCMGKKPSGRLRYETGSNTARANLDPPNRPIFSHMPNLLQVGVPDALGLVVGMTDVVAHVRRLSAEFACSHDLDFLSS